MIDDGKILLKVIETNKKNKIHTEVIQGGELSSKKGFNLPNTEISQPALTDKDIKDAISVSYTHLTLPTKRIV